MTTDSDSLQLRPLLGGPGGLAALSNEQGGLTLRLKEIRASDKINLSTGGGTAE